MLPNSSVNDKRIKPVARRMTILVVVGIITTVGTIFYGISRFSKPHSPSTPVTSVATRVVTALGRLEPHQEVIQLSAPASSEGSRVDELLVQQGERVQKGQVVAILDSRNRLRTALDQAFQQVKVAKTRLAQVKAGAKAGEINAQKAAINRLAVERLRETAAGAAAVARIKAELRNAQIEDLRYQTLYKEGAISTSTRDSKLLSVETFQQQLNEAQANLSQIEESRQQQLDEAKATLNQIAEVRPTDIAAARAEVDSAIAAVKNAQANLELAYVKAPRNGQILKINAWAGEVVSERGIVDIGQTEQMYVVAEVYESDITKVRLGQTATIVDDAVPGKLQGIVAEIGLQIDKRDVLDTDPTADTDARVVEVKIRLTPAASKKVSGLTNLQVKTVINI